MTKHYKDFYGGTATISETGGKYRLTIYIYNGKCIYNRTYNTIRGAKIAMGKLSEGWREIEEA